MRTTIKETIVENMAPYINLSSVAPKALTVYDPDDIMRTTIKETTIDNDHMGQIQGVKRRNDGYVIANMLPKNTQKQFLSDHYYQGHADGQTGTGNISPGTPFETVNTIPYAGKTVTFSFYARKGADYSAASSALPFYIYTGTGTDQNPYSGFTGGTQVMNTTATLTTTWQRFTASVTLATSVTQISPFFTFTPTGTAGTNDYFEITGVQLEASTVASSYAPNGSTYQAELAACQRYLPAISGASNSVLGYAYSTTGTQIYIKFPTTARVAATGITVNGTLAANYALVNQGFTSGTPTAIGFNSAGTDYGTINITTTAAAPTLVTGQPAQFQTLTANGYVLFTGCEL
jgi:hypothetical protein